MTSLPDTIHRSWPQPTVAVVMSLLALAALVGVWLFSGPANLDETSLLLSAALVAAIPVSYHYPIHLSRSQKVEVTSIPIYLAAALLPTAPFAATVVGLGILAGELHVRSSRGNLPGDIV